MPAVRVLSVEDIRRLVSMPDAIRLMRDAFAELSSGLAHVPQRTSMEMSADNSRSLTMPAYFPGSHRYSVKIVTLSENNPAKGLPFIRGMLLLFDSDTGAPLALVDAGYITSLRTGAASGLATDILARKDARTAMIFGAGTQARSQLEGILAVRKLEKIFVYSPNKQGAEHFAAEMADRLGATVLIADSPGRVRDTEIVSTATNSERPVFDDRDIRPGTHINGIGSYKPTMQEIPTETVRRSIVVVDSRAAALAEAGDVVMALHAGAIQEDHIRAELGEIVLGKVCLNRDERDVTLFKSVGNAVQDLAIASHVFNESRRAGIGTVVEI